MKLDLLLDHKNPAYGIFKTAERVIVVFVYFQFHIDDEVFLTQRVIFIEIFIFWAKLTARISRVLFKMFSGI